MTGNIEDLQKAFRIIENFCASFGFKVNINKTEICVFSTRGANTPNGQVYYLGQLIKVVKITAERTRHAVQNRISNMGGLSPELKLRLGDLLIRPVASFGCQIWGVNFLIIIIIIIKGHSLRRA